MSTILDSPDQFVMAITRHVKDLLPCNGIMIVMEPEALEKGSDQFETLEQFHFFPQGEQGEERRIETQTMEPREEKDLLDYLIRKATDDFRRAIPKHYPEYSDLHTIWLRSEHTPRLAAGIFRLQMPDSELYDFSPEERELVSIIEPDLIYCVRLYAEFLRPRISSFDFFAERCREVALTHGLTSSEYRVLRRIIGGASNKAICDELGISLATVKTHISHILQKTGCRNRTDIIGRFFSSKNAVLP